MNDPTAITTFEAMRHAMVASQLRTNAVNDPRVVTAMARVPRERFVPDALRRQAYRDGVLPLANGRQLNLPMATGRLLTEAMLRPEDGVLLIGAATGYTAMLLAELCARVVAVESDADLAAQARAALGETHVDLVEGPLPAGHAAGAPYDVLVIDGAIEGPVPRALWEQLAPDGRCVTGLVDRGVTRLASGRRSSAGFGVVPFADVECVILPGFAVPRSFSF